MEQQRASQLYHSLAQSREIFLQRAYECAELTIPSLLPRDPVSAATRFPTPWQSVGAEGVKALAAKLLLVGFPPNAPMFRMQIDDATMVKYGGTLEQKTALETALSKFERAVMTEIEVSGDRAAIYELIKQLIVCGNVLVHDSEFGLRVYNLKNYVVKRDPSGNPLEIVAREQVDWTVLPDRIRGLLKAHNKDEHKPVTVYTRLCRTEKNWEVHQEVECPSEQSPIVDGTEGTYPLDKCPWLALRFTRIDGLDYGTSYVDEILGDLRSLEELSQALVEGARAAAKLLFLVSPNGLTKMRDLAESPNGGIIPGLRDDVATLQAEKFHDFATAEQRAKVLEDRLARAFLMHASIQRDAERVTAEEIRYMAQELETGLGGFYTLFAQEFQLPYVKIKIAKMQRKGKLPQLPKGIVNPTIVTGIEALGRGNDRQKLLDFAMTLRNTFGEQAVAGLINVREFVERLAAADGIDADKLIPTEEELQEAQAAAAQQQQLAAVAPNLINAGGKLLDTTLKQSLQQPPPEQPQ